LKRKASQGIRLKKNHQLCRRQLIDISKLGLNSKIKKFSYSFIFGKDYSPPKNMVWYSLRKYWGKTDNMGWKWCIYNWHWRQWKWRSVREIIL